MSRYGLTYRRTHASLSGRACNRVLGCLILGALCMCCLSACRQRYVPKPYGYCRIALPEHAYKQVQPDGVPMSFDINTAAEVEQREDPTWLNIVYPSLKATIHCNYKPVRHNLRELSDDAQEFVFKHANIASAIPEQGFEDPENNVYGVYYELKGNTASPMQFYLTDSTRHFFRGSLYFNSVPNQDSLAPVIDFLSEDMRRLIESARWK